MVHYYITIHVIGIELIILDIKKLLQFFQLMVKLILFILYFVI